MTGNQFKKTRIKLGITQTRLADILGYKSYQTILRYEKRSEQNIPMNVAVSVTMLVDDKKKGVKNV
jgi:DNA-binding XRE family transcriptional regulator